MSRNGIARSLRYQRRSMRKFKADALDPTATGVDAWVLLFHARQCAEQIEHLKREARRWRGGPLNS